MGEQGDLAKGRGQRATGLKKTPMLRAALCGWCQIPKGEERLPVQVSEPEKSVGSECSGEGWVVHLCREVGWGSSLAGGGRAPEELGGVYFCGGQESLSGARA